MGFYRRRLGFPEMVAQFRARHPGLTYEQAVKELSYRSAAKRRANAAAQRETEKIKKWWEN